MAGLSDRIYMRSPVWAQQVMVALYGMWWRRRRYGGHFNHLYTEFKERDLWSKQQFHVYQERKLQELFTMALRSPYYGELFSSVGVDLTHPPFETLKRIPYLTKEVLRSRARALLTQDPIPQGTVIFKSSGTTGTPTEIFYSPEFHGLELAIPAARNLGWAGVPYNSRRVMFGVRKVCRFEQSKPPFWRFSPSEDMAYASIYHLSPKNLPYYVDFLRSYHPAIIMGYPSALSTVAHYALEHDRSLSPARVVVTTSETVSAKDRAAIEAAWQCKVHDRYGAVEGCVFASQCEYGRYHVSPDVGIVEIVDQNGAAVKPGESGEVICTGLLNTLQPLIRYRIGDVASWAVEQECACGRHMPILDGIDGRFEDLCYTADGREMLRFDTVFKGVDNIKEGQIVQEKLDLFRVNVVPAETFGEHDIEKIQKNMRLHVGEVQIIVDSLPGIPRSASGKFRAVLCNLSEAEKDRLRKIRNENR